MPAFRRSEFLAVLIPLHLSKIFFVTVYCQLLRDIPRNPICVFFIPSDSLSLSYKFLVFSYFPSINTLLWSNCFPEYLFFNFFLIVHSWLIKCYTLCWVGLQLVTGPLCYRQRRRVGRIRAALLRSWDRVQCQLSVCHPHHHHCCCGTLSPD